jgi:nucleoside-diphosphate-sugar epimerase
MRILILGSTGFVGRNLAEALCANYDVIKVSRGPVDKSSFYFDLMDRGSWQGISATAPDLIINCAAYGVIKNEMDHEVMYNVNYTQVADFFHFMRKSNAGAYWLQIGTAFEYDLAVSGGITESTPCLPRTHYGISKLMFSRYLRAKSEPGLFSIFRPFGLFGKYEDDTKFFPMLINAQKIRQPVKLSAGTQKRDYFFVNDLGQFVKKLIDNDELASLPSILNLGLGESNSLRSYSDILSQSMKECSPELWQWNNVGLRENESSEFYNSSSLAFNLGFRPGRLEDGFRKTSEYYLQTR